MALSCLLYEQSGNGVEQPCQQDFHFLQPPFLFLCHFGDKKRYRPPLAGLIFLSRIFYGTG
jgi:hypothetical protein